jgi:DNA-directed RNA polymerase sigma subunit (sigma70/sigma32)
MSEPMTFKQIGKELGVSEQRAQRIVAQALHKIRRSNTRESLEKWKQLVLERRRIREGSANV